MVTLNPLPRQCEKLWLSATFAHWLPAVKISDVEKSYDEIVKCSERLILDGKRSITICLIAALDLNTNYVLLLSKWVGMDANKVIACIVRLASGLLS